MQACEGGLPSPVDSAPSASAVCLAASLEHLEELRTVLASVGLLEELGTGILACTFLRGSVAGLPNPVLVELEDNPAAGLLEVVAAAQG